MGPFVFKAVDPAASGFRAALRARAEGGVCPRSGEATGLTAGGPGACPAGSHWHTPSLTPPTVPTSNGRIVTPSSLPASPSTRTRAPVRRSRRPMAACAAAEWPWAASHSHPKRPGGARRAGSWTESTPSALRPQMQQPARAVRVHALTRRRSRAPPPPPRSSQAAVTATR